MEGEARFADIILPACTNFERWDISEFAQLLRLHPGQLQPDQSPRDRPAEEVHRAARREQVRLRNLRRRRRAHGHRRRLHRGRQDRVDWVQGVLPRHRPAQAHHLGGVRKEGLLRRARCPTTTLDAGHALVRRRAAKRHARLGPAPRRHGRLRGPADAVRQDRVREHEPQASRDGRDRPRAAGHGPAVHPQLGGPSHHRAVRQVPAANGVPAPALQLPHHGRRQGELAERGQGAPHPARRRALLLDHPAQLARTRRRAASAKATSCAPSTTAAR